MDAEDTGQLQVGPMIKGIAHRVRHGLSPLAELLEGGTGAGDVLLRHTVAAHGPPLVMVASEPEFRDVAELVVLGNHLGYQMAVIIYNRQFLSTFVIKFLSCAIAEHEVFVDK